jgi:hypothetical protein
MMRITTLTATVLCLSGCFVFDNPYDKTPAAALQIVVSSSSYGGTYVWTPQDNAYEAAVGSTQYYIYMDGNGVWCLASLPNRTYPDGSVIAHSLLSPWGTLPPMSSWSGSGTIISAIDDSEVGISIQKNSPDIYITGFPQTLQVAFHLSSPGNSATYQWQKSPTFAQSFDSPIPIGTGSTYQFKPTGDYGHWYRVIITPTDSTGTIQGTSVASQPVGWP